MEGINAEVVFSLISAVKRKWPRTDASSRRMVGVAGEARNKDKGIFCKRLVKA